MRLSAPDRPFCRNILYGKCQCDILIRCECIEEIEILEYKSKLLSSELVKLVALECCDILAAHIDVSAANLIYS